MTFTARSWRAWATTTAGVLALGLIATAAPATAVETQVTGRELLANSTFADGATGWTTNKQSQKLSVTAGVATLSTTTRGMAVLNDRPNAVQDATKGSTYVVTARVRTTSPKVSGALRIREVSCCAVRSSQNSFSLSGTSWRNLSLTVTTAYAQSALDVNVVAWDLPVGADLLVDSVSVRKSGSTTPTPTPTPTNPVAPIPTPTPSATRPAASTCVAPVPSGTLFGASLTTVGQSLSESLRDIDSAFGRSDVVRHFSPGLPFGWSSSTADALAGRTLVVSFKVPPAEIIAGKHDTFFRNWFATAPTDQTVYWSYFHEPENNIGKGEFTAAQYREAWKRLATLANDECNPRLHATLILTSWTMDPQSRRDYRTFDAGSDYVQVLAFDPYNGLFDFGRTYYESPQELIGFIVDKMRQDGRPWGLAELGSRLVDSDSNGVARAAWLAEMGEYTQRNGASFVSYFHSIGTNGDFRLLDGPSRDAWARLVER